jgi:hypothetical protein
MIAVGAVVLGGAVLLALMPTGHRSAAAATPGERLPAYPGAG